MVKNINQNLVVVDNYSIFGHNDTPINILIITFTYNLLDVWDYNKIMTSIKKYILNPISIQVKGSLLFVLLVASVIFFIIA